MVRYLDTFIFKGEEYNVGSTVKLKGINGNIAVLKRHYIDEYGNHKYDMIKINDKSILSIKTNNLDNVLVDVTNVINDAAFNNEEEYYKDTEIDSLFYGWVFYIVLMLFCLILNEWIFGLAITSFIFFKWRKKKLKKD